MGQVNIEDEALNELKRAVIERHGKLRGALGEEATRAVCQRTRELKEEA